MTPQDPIAWGGPIAAQRRERLVRGVWMIGPRPIATVLYELAVERGGPAALAEADKRLTDIARLAPQIRALGAGDWPAWPLREVKP